MSSWEERRRRPARLRRQILVDHARAKRRLKRGGARRWVARELAR